MKALIIGSPAEGQKETPERFQNMRLELSRAGIEVAYSPSLGALGLARYLGEHSPDLVFSAPSHTADPPERRRIVHEELEAEGFAYVGSSPAVIELALDKAALKTRWSERGVETPEFFLLEGREPEEIEVLLAQARNYPYIVKPAKEGNSRGIGEDSVVRDGPSLGERARACRARFGATLVEGFLGDEPDIREFTVAMIGSPPSAYYLPAEIRLKRPKRVRVISTEDKEAHHTQASPVLDPELRDRLAAFAARAFAAAGTRDYARCDLLMTGDRLFAIEINGQPMIPDLWFEACAACAGFDSRRYVSAIFLASICRQRAGAFPDLPLPAELARLFTDEERARLQGVS